MAVTTEIWYCLYNPGSTIFNPNNEMYLDISSDPLITPGPSYQQWTITSGNPPWQTYKSKIKRIFISGSNTDIIYPQYCNTWFSDCTAVESMDISKLDTSNVTDMSFIFYNCRALTSLDLSGFDTSNVTNMNAMFSSCRALTSLDLSGFDTSNVTNMSTMFANCWALTSLDLSGFNTSDVTNMASMFSGCRALTSLDLSDFDTSNLTYMSFIFYNCWALTSLDLSSFNTSNVRSMESIFSYCNALASLDLSGFDTSNVTTMASMFYNCEALTSLDLSSFDTSNVTNMSSMFYGCNALASLDISEFDTSNVTTMASMFYNCNALTPLDVSGFNTSNVTKMNAMFYNCDALTSLDVSGFNTSKVTNMAHMFSGCNVLTSLDISGFDTSNVTSMASMFYNCNALTPLDVSGFNTSNVTSMDHMFYNCDVLTSLDVSGFDTSKVEDMQYMFYGCEVLTSLDVSGFNTSNVTIMSKMFSYCDALTSLDLSGFNTSNVTNMNNMFSHCNALISLDLSGFDTSNVTSMYSMFDGCNALTSLDVSGFDTSNVMDMSYMFFGCENFSGDVFINCDPTAYSKMFSATKKPIYLFGTSTILPQLAATADYGNVIPWSLSDTLKADRDDELPSSAKLSVTVSRFRGNNETLSDIKVYEEPSATPMVLTWDDPTFTMDSAVKTFNTTLYNLDETKTHSIRVVVEDAYGTADAKIVSIPTVYYTIDFLAGGKEISFGEKATKDDLYSPVTGSSAPTFVADTYYERSVDGVSITYTLLDAEPDDWANTYLNYYILARQNGLFKCAMEAQFSENTDFHGSAQFKSGFIVERLVGEIKTYAGNTVPTGWLECNGAEVAIADYPLLYNAIGNLWGTASDAYHFKLPNLKGKVPVGQDTSDTSFDAIGETGGSKYIQQHSHSATHTNPTINSGGGWSFYVTALGARTGATTTVTTGSNTTGLKSGATRYRVSNNNYTASFAPNPDGIQHGGHSHGTSGGSVSVGNINTSGLSTGSTGNLQPYAVVKYIICAV